MAFWTDGANSMDPKRKFRFKVQLLGYAGAAQNATWYTKTVKKPSFQITEAEHTYLNHKFYYPGRTEWQTIDITLVDPADPDAASKTLEIISAAGYNPPTDPNSFSTMSKFGAVRSLGGVIIDQIDDQGSSLEKWTLVNPFITNVDFGDLSYEDDALSEITLTFRYDWASFVGVKGGPYSGDAPLWKP